jgi:hypothetical protein
MNRSRLRFAGAGAGEVSIEIGAQRGNIVVFWQRRARAKFMGIEIAVGTFFHAPRDVDVKT